MATCNFFFFFVTFDIKKKYRKKKYHLKIKSFFLQNYGFRKKYIKNMCINIKNLDNNIIRKTKIAEVYEDLKHCIERKKKILKQWKLELFVQGPKSYGMNMIKVSNDCSFDGNLVCRVQKILKNGYFEWCGEKGKYHKSNSFT